jgi:hypothetical protein
MPAAYTNYELTKTYEEIALERVHQCNNCECRYPLSHSHLVPKSRDARLATVKENIVYHCLSGPNGPGCHDQFSSMDVVFMKDFEHNFRIIYKLDPQYFWIRVTKLFEYWSKHNQVIAMRVRNMYLDME